MMAQLSAEKLRITATASELVRAAMSERGRSKRRA
jgi:hypothetical protein